MPPTGRRSGAPGRTPGGDLNGPATPAAPFQRAGGRPLPGPVFAACAGLTAVRLARAIRSFVRDYLASAREVTRSEGPIVARLVPPLVALGVTTDISLPVAGVQVRRLGRLAMAGVGSILLWAPARGLRGGRETDRRASGRRADRSHPEPR